MLTTSQLTPAQRRIRESMRTRPPDLERRAQHHHLVLPRVHEGSRSNPGAWLIRVVEEDDDARR